MFTDKDVKDAFKASGDKVKTMDEDLQQVKAYMGQLAAQMKRYGKAIISGTMNGDDYPGFWPNENMAKEFGGIIQAVVRNDIAQLKDMNTSVGSEGGVLVPDELSEWMIQKLGKYGKFRKNSLPVKMGSGAMMIPKLMTDLIVFSPGEGKDITASDLKFGLVKLTAQKLACLAVMSRELDEDSVIGMSDIIGISMARSIARKEDLIGFMGDGTEDYFGMTGVVGALMGVDETIGNIKSLIVASGNAYSEITLGDFERVVGMLPEESDEDARWFMSKKFYYGVVHPLARAEGVANIFDILSPERKRYLLGYPVEFVSCMPSVEANNQICAVLGDLVMGASFGERRQLELAQSHDVLFTSDQVLFRGIERIDINVHGVGDTDEPGSVIGLITAGS